MSRFFSPKTLVDALELQRKYPNARWMAGGTDLLVRLRREAPAAPAPLISLEAIAELQGIHEIGEGSTGLAIGASTTFAQILASSLLAEHAPILLEAAQSLGAPAIRNMATLGGNLCTASPAGDALPPLYALDAQVELVSIAGRRCLPLREFISAPGQNALASGEILSRVLLPCRSPFALQRFEKVGKRQSLAIAVVSFAGLLKLDDEKRIVEARFAWGSVGPTVVTLPEVESMLRGRMVGKELLQQAVERVHESVCPIGDLRSGANYRRRLAGNLLRRFLLQLPLTVTVQIDRG